MFGFLSPLLLIGVAAAGAPFLLHLLARVKAVEMPFSTLRFLTVTMEKTARRRRLDNLLLLIVRALILALLAVAAAKPVYRAAGGLALARPKTTTVLILDNSYSMDAPIQGDSDVAKSRFSKAKQAALERLTGPEHPARAALIFTNGSQARRKPALTGDLNALRLRIEAARTAGRSANLTAAIEKAEKILHETDGPNKEILLLTDLQAISIPASLRRGGLSSDPAVSVRPPLMIVGGPGRPTPENVAITNLRLLPGGRVVGLPVHIDTTVENFSTLPRTVRMEMVLDGKVLTHLTQSFSLNRADRDGARRDVRFTHVFRQAGPHVGRIQMIGSDDALSRDDHRHFCLEIFEKVRAVILKAQPAEADSLDPGFFLIRALDPYDASEETTWAIVPSQKTLPNCQLSDLDGKDLIILADPGEISQPQVKAIKTHLLRGGNLAIFPGPHTNVRDLNKTLGPLMPAELGEPVDQPKSLAWVDVRHPLFTGLFPKINLRSVLVRRYCPSTPQPNARVLARLDSQDPFLIEGRFAAGHVFLFTTSAARDGSNLPTQPLFLPLMVRLALSARTPTQGSEAQLAGAAVRFFVRATDKKAPLTGATEVDVTDPTGATQAVKTIREKHGNLAVFHDTFQTGVYRWRTVSDAIAEHTGQFAVNPDAGEGNLAAISESATRELLGRDRRVYIAPDLPTLRNQLAAEARGAPLWNVPIAIVLVLALVECFLANRPRLLPTHPAVE